MVGWRGGFLTRLRINGYTGLKNLITMFDSEFEENSIDKEEKTAYNAD